MFDLIPLNKSHFCLLNICMIKAFKVFLVCLLISTFILFPKPSQAETIYQPDHVAKFRIEKDEGIINLQGEINDDSAAQTQAAFDYFAKNHIRNIIIHLHSLGGSVKSGYNIIELMVDARHHNINVVTLVDHKEYCASMCTAIFAEGESRIAAPDTIWLFHSPFIKLTDEELGDPVKVAEAKEAIKLSRRLMMRAYYSADPAFAKNILDSVVNDDSGKPLMLFGADLIVHTATFITMPIAD